MRFLTLASLLILICACTPQPIAPISKASAPGETRSPTPSAASIPAPDSHAAPEIPAEKLRATRNEFSGITFEGVAFDSRNNRLIVLDQNEGPGTTFSDAGAAARSQGGLAAINAGFFTPEGNPLGLVVSSGNQTGAWNSESSLGSGLWMEDQKGRSSIVRRESIGRSKTSTMRELLQAGPMLINNARPVSGLNSTKSAARTLILWDGGHRWWIGRASPCTLSKLGSTLAHASPAGWPNRQALNLDGGRSSDLWISKQVPGGPLVRRPIWNRPVRNFLVLKQR